VVRSTPGVTKQFYDHHIRKELLSLAYAWISEEVTARPRLAQAIRKLPTQISPSKGGFCGPWLGGILPDLCASFHHKTAVRGIVRNFLEPKTFNPSMCLPLRCDHIPERCS
jgi:hypothetical protein